MTRRFVRFLLIGGCAFWLDALTYFAAGYIFVLIQGGSVPVLQKLMGFAVGVTTTYLYNSWLTFSVQFGWLRFVRYVGSQLLGMLANLSAFLILKQFMPDLLALAGATILATVVNFAGARRVLRS